MSSELAKIVSDDVLTELSTFDDFAKYLTENQIPVEDAERYGTGFNPTDKQRFVDEPFILLSFRFHTGAMGEFVICHVVGQRMGKAILVDGSTGMYAQLKRIDAQWSRTETEPRPLLVKQGLTVSEYTYIDRDTGESKPAKTYYLNGVN